MTVSPYFISFPTSPASPIDVQRTNTLAVTSIPKEFFQPLPLNVLRNHFTTYGHINRWVPLPGFGRIIVVYTREDDAETAKIHCDPIVLEQTQDRLQLNEKHRSGLEVLIEPHDGDSGVGIYVEGCDGSDDDESDEDWVYGQSAPARAKWLPVATVLPPMLASP
ncbi:hypothetical protein MVEN_01065700 [Mycena venus]|uniref:RRM domain-containing protein n=1 Tax=Mycena venus TaxID=2733690 RepID=A0A8H7CZE5_9AGAR|nr:hypothetical protein MVEN_01065700 [Mycena venus]